MPLPSNGWAVQVTHPDTSRTLTPDILDDPAILPSLNSLPEVRVPVRKSDLWLDPGWNSDPTMDVWLDGAKQPIDILERVEERQDRVILVGVGATDLRNRAAAEFRSERRHDAADSIIDNNTTYNRDIDTPTVDSKDGVNFQDPTLTNEFDADLDYADTDPVDTSGDETTIHQTSFTQEGEIEGQTVNTSTDYSDGEAASLTTVGETFSYDFTTGYVIPAEDFDVGVRWDTTDSTFDGTVTWKLDGETISEYSPGGTSLDWQENIIDNAGSGSAPSNDLPVGSHTLTAELTSDDSNSDAWFIDVIQPKDTGDRYSWGPFNYTYDNTLNADNGWLDGPGTHPPFVRVIGEDELSAFSITAGDITLSINDTTGDQAVQLSNDRGSTWTPTNGDEENTNSVDVTFGTPSSTIRMRMDLASFSPNGTSDQTPRENYDAQTVTDYDLNGDIDLELLLTDYSQDQSVIDHLNQIATTKFIWSANLDSNGDYQVSWTQPGQRTAATDPDISDVTIQKNSDVYDKVVIFGGNKNVRQDTFDANSSFTQVDSGNTNIVEGSETVYDDTTNENFDRDDDYEMDYSDGEVRVVDGSSMDTSQSYTIDYQLETIGSYPSDVTNPNREFVDNVPGVLSDRGAEQIAFVLQTDNDTPIYSADVVIPREDATFDVLEALTLDAFDLPDEATPLETRGEVEISPTGIRLRLGSRSTIEESLSSISQAVSSISKQV